MIPSDRAEPTGPTGPSVDVAVAGVSKSFGDVGVLHDVEVEVDPGQMLALLGPSGCGKTTLLRIVAGLERPEGGEVRVGGRVLVGPSTFVAPDKRAVGLVFQDGALFPHLDVGRNVGYGLDRLSRSERSSRVSEALDLVGLSGFEDRSPATLSGGQQQRVALARALAPQPSVLLLDEPFSNLDAALRSHLRTDLHQLLIELGITTIFVTHDQEEAFVLGDQVAVMREGRIIQRARPTDLYREPVDRWLAEFVGAANLVAGVGQGDHATTILGPVPLSSPSRGPVDVLVRPESIRLTAPATGQAAGGQAADGLGAVVQLVEYRGSDTSYLIDVDGVVLRATAQGVPSFGRGDPVDLAYAGPPTVTFRDEEATTTGSPGDVTADVAAGEPARSFTSR